VTSDEWQVTGRFAGLSLVTGNLSLETTEGKPPGRSEVVIEPELIRWVAFFSPQSVGSS